MLTMAPKAVDNWLFALGRELLGHLKNILAVKLSCHILLLWTSPDREPILKMPLARR